MTIRIGSTARLAAALLATAVPATARTANEAERLVSPALPDFVVGYQAANGVQSIREDVPRGETVEDWTRMVTTQRFPVLPGGATPADMLARISGAAARDCPGAQASPVTSLTLSGHAAARMKVDCPSSTGGVPESFVILAVAGTQALHVKQAAVRGPGASTRLGWGQAFLAATRLCSSEDRAACR